MQIHCGWPPTWAREGNMSKDNKISWSLDWCDKNCPYANGMVSYDENADFLTWNGASGGLEFGIKGHPACVKIDFAEMTKTQKALIEYDCRHSGIIEALEKWADWERDCKDCPLYKDRLPKTGETMDLF